MMYKITLFNFLRLLLDYAHTKIFYREARLIRRNFYLRYSKNRPLMNNLTTGVNCRFDIFNSGEIIFGNNIQINDYCHFACIKKIQFGDDVLIASRVFITDHDHGFSDPYKPISGQDLIADEVVIGDNTWIGEGACILRGTKIGKGSVVGSNAVVKGVFPDRVIIAGVPAKIIRSIT